MLKKIVVLLFFVSFIQCVLSSGKKKSLLREDKKRALVIKYNALSSDQEKFVFYNKLSKKERKMIKKDEKIRNEISTIRISMMYKQAVKVGFFGE